MVSFVNKTGGTLSWRQNGKLVEVKAGETIADVDQNNPTAKANITAGGLREDSKSGGSNQPSPARPTPLDTHSEE